MSMRLTRADVVLLAQSHNPAAVSPQWLREKGLLTEEPNQFVHTPQFLLFDSDTFSLMLDSQRLHVTAKRGDTSTLEALASGAVEYVRLQPHVSYRGLGLNFTWVLEATADERLPSITAKVGAVEDLSVLFPEHKLSYGALIYAKKDSYVLRLRVEPQEDDAIVYGFNYHHEVAGQTADKVAERIQRIPLLAEESRHVVQETSGSAG